MESRSEGSGSIGTVCDGEGSDMVCCCATWGGIVKSIFKEVCVCVTSAGLERGSGCGKGRVMGGQGLCVGIEDVGGC